jgi:regulatory protein
MGKITNIKSQSKKGRINIFIDNSYAFSVFETALVDQNLYLGKEINEKEINALKDYDLEAKCLAKAYHLLSFRPRSESEIKKRLLEKFSAEVTESSIKKLKKANYINDEEFVNFWLANRKHSRGPQLLRSELIKKGICRGLIDSKLAENSPEDDVENATREIELKTRFKALTKTDAYKKVGPYLARRGYSYDVIKEVIKKLY